MKTVTVKRIKCVQTSRRTTLSNKTYNLLLGCFILYGLILTLIMVMNLGTIFSTVNPLLLVLCAIAIGLLGVYTVKSSNNPLLDFLGYTLIVIPIGAELAAILPAYALEDIQLAIGVTTCVTTVMTLMATAFPRFFSKLGEVLFIALISSILGEISAFLLGFRASVYNWIFVVIYSLYVGYDWYRAQTAPKTLDSAIDSAAKLYLDIINLFLRLFKIIARSKRRR